MQLLPTLDIYAWTEEHVVSIYNTILTDFFIDNIIVTN